MPRVLSEERVFPSGSGGFPRGVIEVWKREIREDDGSRREQYIWKRGAFVIVVAVDPSGRFVFKREFKYAQMGEFLTFATGAVQEQKSESVIAAAARELREELGMAAQGLELITQVPLVNSPDKSTELHYIVLATNVRPIRGSKFEVGKIVTVPREQMLRQFPADFRIAIQRLAFWEAARWLRLI